VAVCEGLVVEGSSGSEVAHLPGPVRRPRPRLQRLSGDGTSG
jgi:hypothetical protein